MTIAYETDFNKLAESIHADNVKAGWWTDITTGESILPLNHEGVFTHRRNPGELLALVHSEISEAHEANILKTNDTHLTNQRGVLVEIVDAAIRIFDIVGAYGFYLYNKDDFSVMQRSEDEIAIWKHPNNPTLSLSNIWVSRALEGFRKNKIDDVQVYLNMALDSLHWRYSAYLVRGEPDFFKMIQLKREYNLQRADHKIENRLKDDGKKI